MRVSEWLGHPSIKPACWGAVAGAIAITVVGFWGLGWNTSSSAALMAQQQSDAAVVMAFVPYCIAKAEHDPDGTKLTKFRAEEQSYKRSQIVEDSGWATMLGSASPDYALANACTEKLSNVKAG